MDLDGKVLEKNKVGVIDESRICGILKSFIGRKKQVPPTYSAVKFKGKPSYSFARRGIETDLKPRIVSIHDLKLLSLEGDLLTIRISCGSGTYVRSLAHEIGKLAGCGASVKGLRRMKIGDFNVINSTGTEEFTGDSAKVKNFRSAKYIIPIDKLFKDSPSLYIKDKYRKNILNGHPVRSRMVKPARTGAGDLPKKGTFVSIKDESGNLIAVHRISYGKKAPEAGREKINLTRSVLVF